VRSAAIVRTLLSVIPIVVTVAIGSLVYLSGRASSVTRLMGGDGDSASEMRVAALNTVSGLLNSQWLLGSGFGSFAKIYQMVEPDELLQPSYFNHAHNDWLQFPIEGGVPAVLIAVAMIGWIIVSLFSLFRRTMASGGPAMIEVVIVAASFGFLAIGSLVDYPLRQPSLMMLAAFLVTILVKGGSDGSRAWKKH
jgi:O-antigen ligase